MLMICLCLALSLFVAWFLVGAYRDGTATPYSTDASAQGERREAAQILSDLELDHLTGKIDPADYEREREALQKRIG